MEVVICNIDAGQPHTSIKVKKKHTYFKMKMDNSLTEHHSHPLPVITKKMISKHFRKTE